LSGVPGGWIAARLHATHIEVGDDTRRQPMRAFIAAVCVAIVLAIGASFGLSLLQQTSADAYHTGAARLDSQESVDNYGRQG
jgi:hypothetical protein